MADHHLVQSKETGQPIQLQGKLTSHQVPVLSFLHEHPTRQQDSAGPVGFDVHSTDQSVAEKKRKYVVADLPFLLRDINLDSILEPEEAFDARPKPNQGVER